MSNPIISRVVNRYLEGAAAKDPKKAIEKLVKEAEKDLKSFSASLPSGMALDVKATVETPHSLAGRGPYISGKLNISEQDKDYQVRVVMDLSEGTVSVGGSSGNYVFERLQSKGTLKDAGKRIKKVVDFIKEELEAKAKKIEKEEKARAEAEKANASLVGDLKAFAIKAIKRIGNEVRPLGVVVKYYPDQKIDEDSRSIHGYFTLKIEHELIDFPYSPALSFYWDKGKETLGASTSNLVGSNKKKGDVPLGKMEDAMFEIADAVSEDIKRVLDKKKDTTPEEMWSVVTMGRGHGYATEVHTFGSKAKAHEYAKNIGDCYVVKGTQEWNEPLGQIEESDKDSPYIKFVQ